MLPGKTGQVGYALAHSLQGIGEIIVLGRNQMDLSNLIQVRRVIQDIKPALIINSAAYTSVDKAQAENKLAMLINGDAPGVMAEEAKKYGGAIIHYSTNYVFDGTKDTPYTEEDTVSPINVYGSSKIAGEKAIQAVGLPHLILRTSWIYGLRGNNFLLTILHLAQIREELRIVNDQYGSPTWCKVIADATAYIVTQGKKTRSFQNWLQEKSGLYHLAAQGQTTWYNFAEAILSNAALQRKPLMKAITTLEYPLPEKRPSYSVISSSKFIRTFCGLPMWEDSLSLCQS